jgi:hypothetical protein
MIANLKPNQFPPPAPELLTPPHPNHDVRRFIFDVVILRDERILLEQQSDFAVGLDVAEADPGRNRRPINESH